jgi:hypothetical protein
MSTRTPAWILQPRRAAVALALSGLSCAALAEGPQDRYWAELEYFFPTISSTARFDFPSTNAPGTEVRLEDELGLDDRKATPYFTLGARLGDSWRIEFEYYRLNREASRTITRDIQWGDVTYPASATLTTKFDSSVYRLTGGWSFYRTNQAEGGLSFGLHTTDFKLALSGQGNGPAGLSLQRGEHDQLVPLPTIGLYGSYQVADQWLLRGRVDYLSLKYEQYDGSLVNWLAAVDWRFAKNWAAGLGYRFVDYKLESTKDNFHGEVNYRFKGPTLYMQANF